MIWDTMPMLFIHPLTNLAQFTQKVASSESEVVRHMLCDLYDATNHVNNDSFDSLSLTVLYISRIYH